MFMLFAYEHYYPEGGWKDWRGNFETVGDAYNLAVSLQEDIYYGRWHIIDGTDRTVVRHGAYDKYKIESDDRAIDDF